MKIALFTDTYYPDLNGVTISVSNYAKELIKKGNTVYIFAPKAKNYKDKEGYVYRLPSVNILSSEPKVRVPIGVSYKGLYRLLHLDFDIIHAHGNGPFSLLAYEVARAEGIPYVLTFHTLHNEYAHYILNGKVLRPAMIKRIMRFIANRCDGVVTPSRKMEEKLHEFGFKKDIKIIPNFVTLEQFAGTKKDFLHKKLHLKKDAQILLTVGRIGKEKNFNFLVEMFGELAKKENDAHLVFVGQGPERDALKQRAIELKVSDRIHFIGRVASDSMPKVYADTTLFVFASTTETQGVCVLEAAAAGLPFVVAEDNAFEHMVEDGKNGYMVALDKQLFAQKTVSLLHNAKKREAFSRYSQQLANKYFQAEKLTDELIAFYKDMQKKHKLHAKILRGVNGVATRGVRGIRKTRNVLGRVVLAR